MRVLHGPLGVGWILRFRSLAVKRAHHYNGEKGRLSYLNRNCFSLIAIREQSVLATAVALLGPLVAQLMVLWSPDIAAVSIRVRIKTLRGSSAKLVTYRIVRKTLGVHVHEMGLIENRGEVTRERSRPP
jgi:hypothetical protein